MHTALRVIIASIGVLTVAIGLAFLLAPAGPAAQFFISPVGSQGMATLRADFPGFFIGAGVFALLGAWRADPAPLAVPLLMLALALLGRCVSLVMDGMGPDAIAPMVAEAVMIAVLLAGRSVFARQ